MRSCVRPMTMLPRIAVALLLSLVLCACGDSTTEPVSATDPAGTEADAPFLVEYDAPVVSCGGGDPGWDSPRSWPRASPRRSPMTRWSESSGTCSPTHRSTAGLAGLPVPRGRRRGDRVAGAGRRQPPDDARPGYLDRPGTGRGRVYVFGLERDGERWRWTGGGDCHLRPVPRARARVGRVCRRRTSTPRSAEPALQVNEIDCTSSRDPAPYLHEPFVVETAESVTVYWTSTPPEGNQTCPGNPTVSRPLPLDEPLGDRQLLDGSTYPPSPVR